ncbi:hypothetical protein Tco_1551197, partial [Tanacetum coccineum]
MPPTNEIASSNGSVCRASFCSSSQNEGIGPLKAGLLKVKFVSLVKIPLIMPLNKVGHLRVFNLKRCLKPMNLLLLMAEIKNVYSSLFWNRLASSSSFKAK